MSSQPLDCNRALEALQDYLKSECAPDVAALIEQHLADCAPCLCHARFEENFLALLGATATDIRCPEKLRERIREAIARIRQEST